MTAIEAGKGFGRRRLKCSPTQYQEADTGWTEGQLARLELEEEVYITASDVLRHHPADPPYPSHPSIVG